MLDPDTLTATARRIHDLRMAGWRPTEIAREVACSRENVESQCERMKRWGAEFPSLAKGAKPADIDAQIERVVALKRQGLSIQAIAAKSGLPEGRISYLVTLARRRGVDVPWVPGGGVIEHSAVVVSGIGGHGYPRRVIAATEAEARAAWHAWSGGTIEQVEMIP